MIDADGLNAFAGEPDALAGREGRTVIITPHPGEMARLVGVSTEEVQADRLEIEGYAAFAPSEDLVDDREPEHVVPTDRPGSLDDLFAL